MAEYINREDAINLFWPVAPENDGSDGCTIVLRNGQYSSNDIESMLSELPAAEVAEVVRCRECVHSSMPSGFTQRYGEPGTLSCHFGPCNRRNVNENDFCSYGQQKEAEHES